MDLSCLTDAEILEIDKHVQKRWSKLRQRLIKCGGSDDELDSVRVYVESETISVRYHKQYIKIGLGVACLRQGLADKAAFVAHFDACLHKLAERIADELARFGAERSRLMLKRCDFDELHHAWLPFETIAYTRDLLRVERILLLDHLATMEDESEGSE